MSTRPVMILAGGTGGHVFPALAVAERLRERGVPVQWVGTRTGLEAWLVPQAGFPIIWMPLRAPRRRGLLGLVGVMPRVLWAVVLGIGLLLRHRPAVALGMGGYVSSAVALAALLCRVPLIVHEQNAVAGLTNRVLARFAARVLLGFSDVRGIHGGIHLGNPVRVSLCAQPLSPEAPMRPLRLLVVGGSQGAEVFNLVVPEALRVMPEDCRPSVWHQTGSDPAPVARRYPSGAQPRLDAFIEEMDQAYVWADLVLARAGAMTLAELAASARGAVLVPYPHAADGHQFDNASQYAEDGAAEVWEQDEFTPQRLALRLAELARDRATLVEMSRAALRRARPDAAGDVAECLLEFCT